MHPLATYLRELRDIRSSGANVPETSFYGPLANLLNAIGSGERFTPCTNPEGARVLALLLMAQKLDRAERAMAHALKTMEKVGEASTGARLTAALVMARALRAPGRGATHTTP